MNDSPDPDSPPPDSPPEDPPAPQPHSYYTHYTRYVSGLLELWTLDRKLMEGAARVALTESIRARLRVDRAVLSNDERIRAEAEFAEKRRAVWAGEGDGVTATVSADPLPDSPATTLQEFKEALAANVQTRDACEFRNGLRSRLAGACSARGRELELWSTDEKILFVSEELFGAGAGVDESEPDPPNPAVPCAAFQVELRTLLNRHSLEGGSNTPDFVLAAYLVDILALFNRTVTARGAWWGDDERDAHCANIPATATVPDKPTEESGESNPELFPWAEFLDARARLIVHFRKEGKPWRDIAGILSCEPEQVERIHDGRMHGAHTLDPVTAPAAVSAPVGLRPAAPGTKIALAPCPFCGGPAYYQHGAVFCAECTCEGPAAPHDGGPTAEDLWNGRTYQETSATDPADLTELAQLIVELEEAERLASMRGRNDDNDAVLARSQALNIRQSTAGYVLVCLKRLMERDAENLRLKKRIGELHPSPAGPLLAALLSDREYLMGWHANLAGATYDALRGPAGEPCGELEHEARWKVGQEAARQFIATLFAGEPKSPAVVTNDEVRGSVPAPVGGEGDDDPSCLPPPSSAPIPADTLRQFKTAIDLGHADSLRVCIIRDQLLRVLHQHGLKLADATDAQIIVSAEELFGSESDGDGDEPGETTS